MPEDGPAVAAIYAPFVRDTAISFEAEAPDGIEMAARIVQILARYPWLVAEEAGDILGYAYAGAHRSRAAYGWACDVSVYLAPAARRRGVGRALYGSLLETVRRQGIVSAYAGITLPNSASVGFHEAVGFVSIGAFPKVGFKAGRWHDVGWWYKLLRDGDAAPGDILPFSALGGIV